MLQIVFLCVAALFMGNCESADLQVLIDGINVGRSESCTGENVTYVCNISSTSHSWTINDGSSLSVTLDPQVIDERYTLRLVSFNEVVVSSLSVTSFDGLNGVNLTCADGRPITSPPTKKAVAMVLAPPSLPELNVSQVMEDNERVNITLTPPSVSPECVLQYIIYSNCEGLETNITVDPNNTDPTQPVQLTRGGLNLCTCSYNFTAAAVTRNDIGERSDPVTTNKISDIVGNPELTITNDGLKVTVLINPQEPSVFVEVKHSSTIDTNCVVNVDRNTSITSSETTLDCSFAELTPTFCVQFMDGSCQSELVQITSTKLPNLLSGVNITSSTSSIDVIVDVNEGINCDTSQLSTRTTISGENGVNFMNTSAFKDLLIVFEPPSPGVYTCNISIMSGNIVLKSMEEPCSNIVDTRTEDSSESTVPIIVGCVAGVLVVLILIVVIVVLVKKGCCQRCCCECSEECCCKEKKTSSHSATTISVTVAGSQDADTNCTDGKHRDPPLSVYQDPNTIKHETAVGGEVYTMVEKKPKAKKGKEEKDDVAAMYSMPDKSKKNPELMYADLQVSNPQRPPNNRGIGNRPVLQQDTSSVTYASVESPTTKF